MIIFSRKIFGPPPLLSILYMDIIDHVAAAPGPLPCPSRDAQPPSCSARPPNLA